MLCKRYQEIKMSNDENRQYNSTGINLINRYGVNINESIETSNLIKFEDKKYDYKFTEEKLKFSLSKKWKDSIPKIESSIDKESYSIPMPPPNITGRLHMGHVIFITIQDSIARFYSQRGASTFWKPGLDHAGIATHEKII